MMDWVAIASGAGVVVAVLVAIDAKRQARRADSKVDRANEARDRIADALESLRSGEQSAAPWAIERPSKTVFVLRNLTGEPAHGVRIDTTGVGAVTSGLPDGVTVGPFRSVDFRMFAPWGRSVPWELGVEWTQPGGQPRSIAVPIPPFP